MEKEARERLLREIEEARKRVSLAYAMCINAYIKVWHGSHGKDKTRRDKGASASVFV